MVQCQYVILIFSGGELGIGASSNPCELSHSSREIRKYEINGTVMPSIKHELVYARACGPLSKEQKESEKEAVPLYVIYL